MREVKKYHSLPRETKQNEKKADRETKRRFSLFVLARFSIRSPATARRRLLLTILKGRKEEKDAARSALLSKRWSDDERSSIKTTSMLKKNDRWR